MTSLAEVFSGLGWRQFHVAETEKYAHVTYFFNGGVEAPWPGRGPAAGAQPAGVATYDLQPEMSAAGVTDALVEAIEGGTYDFIVANYANPDMVGHTGVWEATVRACEVVDGLGPWRRCSSATPLVAAGGRGALLAITADHGNADEMRDASGTRSRHTRSTRCPFLLAARRPSGRRSARRRAGRRGPDAARADGCAAG